MDSTLDAWSCIPATSEYCRGCKTKVSQIRKHLAQKPECEPFYKQDELDAASLEKRRASRKAYNMAHQEEIRKKKAESYKMKKSQIPGSFNSSAPNEIRQQTEKEIKQKEENKQSDKLPKDGSDKHCHICKTIFGSVDEAKRHAREVHADKKFQCT